MPALNASVQRVTFAGGEAGKALRAREDLARYQIAVEIMENYVVMLEGGATRTPGTRVVLELKDQTQKGRLLPFRVSASDYYMLVINAGKARFIRLGGFIQNPDTTPYELTVPWVEAELASLRSTTQANQMFVVVGTTAPQEITRLGHTNWTCAAMAINNGPVGDQNIATAVTIQASAVTGNAITLTGVGNPLTSDWIGSVLRLDEPTLEFVPEWIAGETAIPLGGQRRWNGNVYAAANGPADAGVNPPIHTEGTVISGASKTIWTYLHSGFGYVRITAVVGGNSGTADVLSRLPDSVRDHPTYRWYPPAWTPAQGFPSLIAFNSPMLFFMRDEAFWFSSKLDPRDLGKGTGDEEAFSGRLRSPDGSLVTGCWAAASGGWLIGTSDIEWILRGPNLSDALTLSNIKPIPEDSNGSIAQVPAVMYGGVMYIGADGKRLHFATVDPNRTGAQRLDVEELSVEAAHIFFPGAVKVVWQRNPHKLAWIMFADGTLATLTYMPKQSVLAFARQPMLNAFVEDIDVIPAIGGGTELYMIVRRTIAGTTKRYVEQLADFFQPLDNDNPTAEGAWFLDCAQHYSGAPITTLTSLAHLEGQEVGVFADGAMQKRKTVAGGTITLDRAASDVLVGIPKVARIKDLPRNVTSNEGSSAGDEKTIYEVVGDFLYSAGGKLYANRDAIAEGEADEGEPITQTGSKKKGAPLALFTGKKKIPLNGEFAFDAQAELVNDDAVPCTVLGLSPGISVEEDT
jgi:hypothetical protein